MNDVLWIIVGGGDCVVIYFLLDSIALKISD